MCYHLTPPGILVFLDLVGQSSEDLLVNFYWFFILDVLSRYLPNYLSLSNTVSEDGLETHVDNPFLQSSVPIGFCYAPGVSGTQGHFTLLSDWHFPATGGGGWGGWGDGRTDGRTDVKPSCRLGRDWHVPVQPSLGTFLWHRNSDLGVSAKSLASHSFPTSATRMFLSTTFGSPITLNPETPSLQLLAQ